MDLELVNLLDLSLKETEEFVLQLGEPVYRAKQIYKWAHQKGATDFSQMTDLPAALRQKLQETSTPGSLEILAKQKSKDGTAKYLFGLADKETVESVFLPHDYGSSVCVSSQVGCRRGCRFCASTIGGLIRNLTAGEMYAQVMMIQQDTGKRISSVVLMGSGEPLDNLDQVLKFISLVTSPHGLNIGSRHITISTCGVVPGIRRLAEDKQQITLSVSLHAPNNELRNRIMPVNKKYPIELLISACKEYVTKTNRRVTFEYALVENLNDSKEHANQLGRLLKGMLCHVNLIPINRVEERHYKRPDTEKVIQFLRTLEKSGIPVTVRKEMGSDIDAACGQLRRRVAKGNRDRGG